ncbi:hypothetical protein UNSW1_744 [Campylobacter concisus UNSW1]|nr:hypothetical protein UNSW1_744 [Campylobacter concisus UNSW1]
MSHSLTIDTASSGDFTTFVLAIKLPPKIKLDATSADINF